MRKGLKTVIAAALAVCLCVALCACNKDPLKLNYKDTFALEYDTGMDELGNYDDDRFMVNKLNTHGADPGVIYVSEEDDPIYGGWFYTYGSSVTNKQFTRGNDEIPADTKYLAYLCHRSKDLSKWELCGYANGYALIGHDGDWQDGLYSYAPEVIVNPNDEEYPYWMYYNATSEIRNNGALQCDPSTIFHARQHISVARSKTPIGPFTPMNDVEVVNGVEQSIPYINFKEAFDLDFELGVIDISPFLDDDGTLYLLFKPEMFGNGSYRSSIYGMKMEDDWLHADYSSIKLLADGGHTDCTSDLRGEDALLNRYDASEVASWGTYDGGVSLLEGPYLWKHDGRYYLTCAYHGYGDPAYQVLQFSADEPLGDYVGPQLGHGNPLLDGTGTMYMKGTAHHTLLQLGNTMYIVYHRHDGIQAFGGARYYAADKVTFAEVEGKTILVASGPTVGLNFLGEELTGLKNVAKQAKITATSGTGIEYLTDDILPIYTYVYDKTFRFDEDTKITLSFDQPVNVETIMIHNSYESETAFSNVADVRFELAEQPAFLPAGSKNYKYACIKDLAFPKQYYKEDNELYLAFCAPAVATFDPILVKSITISLRCSDRLIKTDKDGTPKTETRLSEIVVLGR